MAKYKKHTTCLYAVPANVMNNDVEPNKTKRYADSFWNIFSFTKDGKIKSSFFVYAFSLSVLFAIVYAASYWFIPSLIDPFLAPRSVVLANIAESITPAFVASGAASLIQRLVSDKKLAALALAFVAAFSTFIILFLLAITEADSRSDLVPFLLFYVPLPLTALGLAAIIFFTGKRRMR
jgi:hypothetical protein